MDILPLNFTLLKLTMSFFKHLAMNRTAEEQSPETEDLVDKRTESFDRELEFRSLQLSLRRLKRWMIFTIAMLLSALVALAISGFRRRETMPEDLRTNYPVPQSASSTRSVMMKGETAAKRMQCPGH